MELRDYIIEIAEDYGIFSLNVISLTKEDLIKIMNRNNRDYLILVSAMRVIRENIMRANEMRIIKYDINDWFDMDLHLRYRVEAMKKSFMACKIRVNEGFDEEEQQEVDEMLNNVEDMKMLEKDVEKIRTLLRADVESPMNRFLGVVPNFLFILKTSTGQEFTTITREEYAARSK
jgi:hypothetical protein